MGCSHSSAQVKSSRRSRRMLPRLPRSHLDLPQQELLSLAIEFLRFSQTFVVNNLLLLQLQGGQGLLLHFASSLGNPVPGPGPAEKCPLEQSNQHPSVSTFEPQFGVPEATGSSERHPRLRPKNVGNLEQNAPLPWMETMQLAILLEPSNSWRYMCLHVRMT